jgi:ABC-type antimicrobial peptide transport system permease subunit
MGIAGALAILFAAVGLYGVVAFMVTQRSHEFGVRLALGAVPRQVTGLVLRRGFTLVGVGATVGGLVAAAVAVILSGITYGVGPADPLAWSGALVVVAGVSILAHVVPARKAASVDPVQALRTE